MEEKPNYYSVMPAIVRYDNELKPNEKLLYGEITSLTNKNNECWATNSYFARLYNVNSATISRWISHLKEKGYVVVEFIYKNETKEITFNTNCTNTFTSISTNKCRIRVSRYNSRSCSFNGQ